MHVIFNLAYAIACNHSIFTPLAGCIGMFLAHDCIDSHTVPLYVLYRNKAYQEIAVVAGRFNNVKPYSAKIVQRPRIFFSRFSTVLDTNNCSKTE